MTWALLLCHLIDEKTEAQRGFLTCLESHRSAEAEVRSKHRQPLKS